VLAASGLAVGSAPSERRRTAILTYVLLVDWTAQGVQAVEQTVERLVQGSQMGETFGCKVEHVWWTQGGHDMVSVITAPDDQAMVAYTLALVRLGNLRTTTLRAWSIDEMREIIGRLPT
jgi:uncharacterized protein with GYD domain